MQSKRYLAKLSSNDDKFYIDGQCNVDNSATFKWTELHITQVHLNASPRDAYLVFTVYGFDNNRFLQQESNPYTLCILNLNDKYKYDNIATSHINTQSERMPITSAGNIEIKYKLELWTIDGRKFTAGNINMLIEFFFK